jgi:hypothetical protein
MKDRKVLLLLIGLALTGLTVFLGCTTGDPDPAQPQTDPVPAEFVGTWKVSNDPDRSDWKMEINADSTFTFTGTVQGQGAVVAKGTLAKDRNSGKYIITAAEVTLGENLIPETMIGGPLSGVDMTVNGNSMTITPLADSEHIMAGFIGGTYTKQ